MVREVERDTARRLPMRGTQTDRRTFRTLAVAVAVVFTTNPLAAGADVKWRSGSAQIGRANAADLPQAVATLAGRPDARHIVVQFDRPIDPKQRKQLQRAGLNLLRHLGNHAFFASFSGEGVNAAALGAKPFLVGLQQIERKWKLAPEVLAGNVPDWAVVNLDAAGNRTVGVYVLFHPDVPLLTDAVNIAEWHGALIRDELQSVNGLVIELPIANINELADEDGVQWIEWPLPRMSEVNDSNRVVTEADIVQGAPYGLDGSGVTVLVYDGGTARASHLDFQGRLTVRDLSGMANHATHVCGTVGGAGVANAAYTGMAPGVTIESYGFEYDGTGTFLYTNPGDLEADYSEAISLYGADLSNNSIGTNTETNGFPCAYQGDYGVTSQLIDTIVRGDGSNPLFSTPFRIVWANGNERQGSRCDVEGYGDYYSTAPPAGAKNHITVGALNSNDDSMTSFSSWGPLDDGRMKPDISAPGCQSTGDFGVTSCSSSGDTLYTVMCGTSMASPTVTGLSSLLLQDFRVQFPTEPDPRNSTVKILLAHNAVDLLNVGPDHQTGYGSVRIQQTIDFMRTGNFLENQVGQGGTFSVLVVVNPGDPELKVTMAWDDFPGTPNVDPALVNDLDLRVFDPLSQQAFPWTLDPLNPSLPAVQAQADHVNNIEQVFVTTPMAGVWRVEVNGFNVPQGPQTFSLCASPGLVACSSQGTISLDASRYPCTATAAISVVDCDLNTSNAVIETVTVTISSTSEPGGEVVLLTETGAETADFRGTIPLDVTNSAGVLMVADGNTVTATYIDANDGQGGVNVPVNAAATVDCAAPLISGVLTTNIQARSATVTFNTNEPANGTVRFGLACPTLTGSASESGFNTAHTINLTGLVDSTTYFYAVDAVDQAGNGSTDDNAGACYTFTTPAVPDYFTELFAADNDLDNLSLTFAPDGSADYYAGCSESITALPIDPAGGTTLVLTDDSSALVTLSGGDTVSLYGTGYGTFYVGSNGYITFTIGYTGYTESLANHFSLPRISALFDDLNPAAGGTVSWEQLADRAVVTWEDVFEYGTLNPSTFQVEMHFNGTIVISYLTVAPTDGLAGLSNAGGVPVDFFESDLSAMGVCGVSCFDGIQNQGEDRIDCGGPCPPCDCLADSQCVDPLFCNGSETCDAFGHCQAGTPVTCDDGVVCTVDSCNETLDICENVPSDALCDDGLACNGAETCDSLLGCQAGTSVNCNDGIACTVDACNEPLGTCSNTPDNGLCNDADACTTDVCDVGAGGCTITPITPCCGNGTCEAGEDCNTCSADCISGVAVTPACGNGVCEPFNRENCDRCPEDCAGTEAGPFCCGDGDKGDNPVGCGDPRCTTGGFACSDAPVPGSCCGDGVCEGIEDVVNCAIDCVAAVCGDAFCDPGEDQCNCAVDCGAPPATETSCTDGTDNDCDGFTDCNDTDCAADPACAVPFCGDAFCDPGEDQCNCAVDCGAPPPTETNCTDGEDNDCDGSTDCNDADCSADPACQPCLPDGSLCNVDEDCCGDRCRDKDGDMICD